MKDKTILRPLKAIRAKCMDCMVGQRKQVATCHIIDCSLWPYRMGRRPNDEEKAKLSKAKEGIRGYNKEA